MGGSLKIELARSSDVGDLVTFNLSMAAETEAKGLDRDTVTAGVERLMEEAHRGFYVVAREAGAVVGSLMVTPEWSDWRCAEIWWIQSVYVRPEARRRGVYRRLYLFVRDLAEDAGNVCGFRLYVARENRTAQRVYEALGMRRSVYLMYEAP